MKKEYFLLTVVIIALGAYLFLHDKDQDNYLLPDIPEINKSEIESIEIIKNDQTIKCFKDNGEWVITEKKYLANSRIIQEIIAAIENLSITTLISEKGNLKRYNLDEEKRIEIVAKGTNKVLRKFSIGKPASTQKHTFITLNDDKNVFHAKKNLQTVFNRSIDSLRDKQVLKFNKSDIKSIEISKGGKKKIITKKELSKKETSKDKPEEKTQWFSQDKSELEQESVDSIVEILADLMCSNYLETQTIADFENETPLLKVTVKTDKVIVFNLFKKTDQDKYPGFSSQNKYLFLLQKYIANDIISNIDKLLNIKQEKNDEETS